MRKFEEKFLRRARRCEGTLFGGRADSISVSHSRSLFPPPASHAFSLVEVCLAIGIISFALLTMVALFGGTMKYSSENMQRREMTEAADSLRSYLIQSLGFTNGFACAKGGSNLLYVAYKSDTNGQPDANGTILASLWTNSGATGLDPYEAARSGHWLRVRLSVSPSNPGGTNLTDAAAYTRSSLFVTANFESLAAPGQTNISSPVQQITLAIRR